MRIVGLLLMMVLPVGICAQAGDPSKHLTLAIQDQTGAAIPLAEIKVDQAAQGLHLQSRADETGSFTLIAHTGRYELAVSAPGFRSYKKTIEIDSQADQSLTISLDVAGGSSGPNIEPNPPVTATDQHLVSEIDSAGTKPIAVKVVVVTMFEIGADVGDAPGEFQYWVEREHLDTVMPFPQGYHDLRMNKEGVLGMVTGVGTARAAASLMALGSDPRFDLSHAYFVVAGIGGIDPEKGSLGSAVWSEYVVDGDLAYELDAREIPDSWATGYVPLGKSTPYEQPRADRFAGGDGTAYHLNAGLVGWAYGLTKNVALTDTPQIAERRMQYAGAAARRPPFVLRGDNLAASTFWHGKRMNAWARAWVSYQTEGKGSYAICGMEDTGTLQALTWLAKAGKVDLSRVLVMRTASNYDQQRQGITAAESLSETKITKYSAYLPALESAYRVGHTVVDALVAGWAQTRDHVPGVGQGKGD